MSHASTITERACAASGNSCAFTACCSGLFCPYTNSLCRSCHAAADYCGDGVPCCDGLFCPYDTTRCRPCHPRGEYCGDGVTCCAGLTCLWSPTKVRTLCF
ncbi:hypothetical protein BDQ12DRAFT_619611 [Crucibulum laeve]|uniref:Uncharacterized protein n=1 Tax=Crucibulum laeve TaxID=68775 RepID=A0A5C3LED6_9AGAR|nr:hypothetical protein BDQ12DRAFT_619611 [Crucibulum laeve]